MKNREKYAEQIKNYKGNGFCNGFIKPIVLKACGVKCDKCIDCAQCRMIQLLWLDEEYKEPETDWSKVPVDTPILVRNYDDQKWRKRHFAKFADGKLFAWHGGKTSYSVDDFEGVDCWTYAKLAEEQ